MILLFTMLRIVYAVQVVDPATQKTLFRDLTNSSRKRGKFKKTFV